MWTARSEKFSEPLSSPGCKRATTHHIHPQQPQQPQETPVTGQFVDLETCAKVPGAPSTTQLKVGQPDSHNGRQGATCCPPPPRRRTPATVSVPAEEERARNWEEGKQQSNWAQSHTAVRHRTHNNTQGNHEVRALQQPPNAATLSEPSANPPPPSPYKVLTHSTRAGAAAGAPGGARHGGGNRAVTSQLRTGQSRSYGDVKSLYGGGQAGGTGGGARQGHPGAPTDRGWEEPHKHTERGSHTRRNKGEHSRQGGGAQQGRRGNQNSGNREPEWRGWESVRMGGSDNKGDGLASNPCSTGIRWGVSPAAQMGCLRNRSGSPPAVRGKRTYGGRPGQRVKEQGTWASRTQKHRNTARQAIDGLWTERRGQQKQSTTPATTSTSSIRQLLGAADVQTAHHATFSTAPTHQLLRSANPETTPARAPAAAAGRKLQPDATCEGKNG